ncbi:MAG: arylamine N-acetyltransferase [Acidobacteriota bacterium]
MDVDSYLARIGFAGRILADADCLRSLQYSHLLSVPFENLDIHSKVPIILDLQRFYEKIVDGLRGGFCYELNGLFDQLLRKIGFRTRIVSARVFNGTVFGPDYDHAALVVTIGDLEYLADVGFGDFASGPLRLVPEITQNDREGSFRIDRSESDILVVSKMAGEAWVPEYSFSPIGRELSEFDEMCDFQQHSAESHFTKGRICSMMTETGRKTLTDNSYIITSNGERTETFISSDNEFQMILKREFGISGIDRGSRQMASGPSVGNGS